MGNKDEVTQQTLTQHARDRWSYIVKTREGLSYTVNYEIHPFGYAKEILVKNLAEGAKVLVWDREFKVGENLSETWVDRIRQG